MTRRQKKQYQRGLYDALIGVEHADGRGKFYDIGYSEAYEAGFQW